MILLRNEVHKLYSSQNIEYLDLEGWDWRGM
jgi:hypothetical protein